jgi:hypothetical protein
MAIGTTIKTIQDIMLNDTSDRKLAPGGADMNARRTARASILVLLAGAVSACSGNDGASGTGTGGDPAIATGVDVTTADGPLKGAPADGARSAPRGFRRRPERWLENRQNYKQFQCFEALTQADRGRS